MGVTGVLEADEALMDLFSAWRERYAGRPETARAHAILLISMGLLLALLPVFVPPLRGLSKLFGGAGGLAIVLAADLFWFLVQDSKTRAQRNYKVRYPLGRRRAFAAVSVLVWWILLVNLGSNVILAPVIGAINVFVLISLFRFATATDIERAMREREIEEWMAYQAEQEALELAAAEADLSEDERPRRFRKRK